LPVKGQIRKNDFVHFSVIVPAYNEEALLGGMLDHLNRCINGITNFKGEIIVVDNNSNDKTSDIAKSKGAMVVFEPVNQISKARNAGACKASGNYLFFIDADTFISQSLLANVLEKLKSRSCAGGGSTLVFDDHQNQYFFGSLVPKLWTCISKNFRIAAGSFVFCRKEYFEKIGGFSEKLFAGEEILFSINYKRICRANGEIFEIIDQFPVVTSSRKLSWFSPLQILSSMMIPFLFPWALKSRLMCWFWYKRPPKKN
jgi:glycosyltransferase involved in cell wall biosynthesis